MLVPRITLAKRSTTRASAYAPARVATFDVERIDSEQTDVTVVAIVGELDLTIASELTERLEELAELPALVVDLNRVHFIDSAALNCLFLLARDHDSLAFVLEPTSPIATTLAIVQLGRAAPLRATLDEAVSALTPAAPAA